MLLNSILTKSQNSCSSIYNNSYFLKNIDYLIGLNILLVIITSIFLSSDVIGYFAIFVIILTILKLLTKAGEKFELTLSDKFLLFYFICVVISLAGSTLFVLSVKGFMKTLTYLGFYVSLIHYFKDNVDKIKYIFITYAACLSFEIAVAFLQNFSSVAEISGWQDMSRLNPEEVMTRVYGTLKPYNPNLFGGYLLATVPSFIGLVKQSKMWSILGSIMGVVAIILTGCRGAYIALFIQLIVLTIFLYKQVKPQLKKLFISFIGVCMSISTAFILILPALRARVISIFAMRNDSSNSFRFNVYNSCIDMFKDNWLLGIGVGNQNFREIYGLYMKTGFDALSAYNIYLETAVESGIFALVGFLGFIFTLLFSAIKKINSPYILCAFISIVGILVHGFVDTVFFRPQIQFTFWIMVAILRGGYDRKAN